MGRFLVPMLPSELDLTPLPLPSHVMAAYFAALAAYAPQTPLSGPSEVDRAGNSDPQTHRLQSDSDLERGLRAPVEPQGEDFCENCYETEQIAKIKGCIRCLRCGFKGDCSGI